MEEGGEVAVAGDGGGGGVRRGCHHQVPDSETRKCLIDDLITRALGQYLGTTGTKEHHVIESKPDHFLDDLRLHNPWTELKQFAKSIDIDDEDPDVHKCIPYIVLLVRLAEKWADAHDGNMPSATQAKKEFKDLIRAHMLNVDEGNFKEALDFSYKVSVTPGISNEIRQIIDDDSAEVNSSSSDFWILVAALKEFIAKEGNGELPLEGTIPDMTSHTEYYVSLQNIYQAKAEIDCLALEHHVKEILKRIGRDPDSVSRPYIKAFCKNSRKLRVHAPNSLFDEYIKESLLQVVQEISESLQAPLVTMDELHWHDVKNMEKTSNHQYLLDFQLNPFECHDKKVCPPMRQGDVLVLTEVFTDGISLLIAVEDEDEVFHTAIPVQLVGVDIISVPYRVAYLGTNIQGLIECWISGHGNITNKEECIVSTMLKIPNKIQSCDCDFKSLDASLINHLNANQNEIICDISKSLSCFHENHIELISEVGPGRTKWIKLLSPLLLKLMDRSRIVVCAPTAIDVLGLINGLYDYFLLNNKLELFSENIICLERKSDLGDHDEISLQSQTEKAHKFCGYPGWKFYINLTIQVLENIGVNSFKSEFMQASNLLLECIRYLQSKVSCFGMHWEEPKALIMTMKEVNDASAGDLEKKKIHCANLLKELKNTLSTCLLPSFNSRFEAKEFCIRNSRVIFCSVNTGFHLNEMNHPIDHLIIDGVDILEEAKTLAPLCLPSLHSVMLVSDNQELQEATLFGKLSCLGFRRHILLHCEEPEIPSRHLVKNASHRPKLLRTEFSWIERTMNTKVILAHIRNQGKEGTCALHSTMATTESMYKFHHASKDPPEDFNYILDIEDMKRQYKIETGYEFGKEPSGHRGWPRVQGALNCLMNQGVMGIDEFASPDKVKRIRISSFCEIDPTKDFDQVCDHLKAGNVVVGSFPLSYNYFQLSPGEVYHFDPNRPILNSNNARMRHAVMFVGSGGPTGEVVTKDGTKLPVNESAIIEQRSHIPHLVYQNSWGPLFGIRGGFGRVGVTSVRKVALVTI